jgi:hypothetical protein
MISIPRPALALLAPLLVPLLLCGTCPAWAQKAAAAPASAAVAVSKSRPHLVVIEDDAVRIEESHVRGAVQRVVVHSKAASAAAYEIQVAPAGRDPSQERGNSGRRTWSIFSF